MSAHSLVLKTEALPAPQLPAASLSTLDYFCEPREIGPPEVSLLTPKIETMTSGKESSMGLLDLPKELHVRIFTYLRANGLAKLQQTCKALNSPELVHSIVAHAAVYVYPPQMTAGFEKQPVGSGTVNATPTKKHPKTKKKTATPTPKARACLPEQSIEQYYTFEHLRNMELLVIARVLSSPEPTVGFVVSKSWCKTALKWLETQQEESGIATPSPGKKKGKASNKKQRMKGRRQAVDEPSPNVNSDITCPHQQLQYLSSGKSARARRRLLDRQAWKILKALYPESTPLESASGECVQCLAEVEMTRKNQADQQEAEKLRRKQPLVDPNVRRFYTRTRGVPEHCLRVASNSNASKGIEEPKITNKEIAQDKKKPAIVISSNGSIVDEEYADPGRTTSSCPLAEGTYFLLPRAWCHGFRKYMKTGEGGTMSSGCSKNMCFYPPPDAAGLLCDAHRMALLPPHLSAYLYEEIPTVQGVPGFEQKHLLGWNGIGIDSAAVSEPPLVPAVAASVAPPVSVPGQGPSAESLRAMRALGLSQQEITRQLSAMRNLEHHQYHRQISNVQDDSTAEAMTSPTTPRRRSSSISKNELLDRENHSVVEILTEEEFHALESCWPGTTLFGLRFVVNDASGKGSLPMSKASIQFNTPVCHECDATGRQCSVVIKNRARGWIKKSSEKSRAPASLEY